MLLPSQPHSKTDQQAVLSGGTALAGQYSVGKRTTLADIPRRRVLLALPNFFGMVSRRDPQTLMRSIVPFTPVSVLRGTEPEFDNGDIVRILSTKEARLVVAVMDAFQRRRLKKALRAPNMVADEPRSEHSRINKIVQALKREPAIRMIRPCRFRRTGGPTRNGKIWQNFPLRDWEQAVF